MKCPKCGKLIEENKKFCSGCGFDISSKENDEQQSIKNNTNEINSRTNKIPDNLKYLLGGVIAVLLLVAIPLCNILFKSYIAQSHFNNYKKGCFSIIEQVNTAIDKQHQIDHKYYYTGNDIINNVLKKQLKYEITPKGETKFILDNGFYMTLRNSRRKCDEYSVQEDQAKYCYRVDLQVEPEIAYKKYSPWGTESHLAAVLYADMMKKGWKE